MSKKHRKFNQFNQTASAPSPVSQELAAEYRIIKHDLIRVVILNVIVLAAVLAVYYTNQQSHYLDELAAKFLHL
jgi:hypothetical protein